ncbi:lysozyme [Phenylobacterium sp.]|uniref:lysozyme n=1 Tax=Phenylobacterium sp. TaxID=1871053 RepID=UPI001215AC8A|nr:lysozyme [Phenylobacterium sp.]THD63515.1 MAG: lysozyme [Phenylobacterium sp.]
MLPRHRVSRTAIDLIKRFEGYRKTAAQLPDGRWTIGHGHTLTARQGAEVSPDDAEALLLYDLIGVAHAVNEAVFATLTQNQFDALASFVFNIGLDSFHQSGVLRRLNEGSLIQAACAMELWRKANVGGERIVVDALVRRRSAEKTLFLTPPGGVWVPAPSPILKPLLDTDAHDIVPVQKPVEVTTSLDGDQLVVTREDAPEPPPVAPEEDAAEGPARAAAESVTARLSTLFQESDEPAFGEASAATAHPDLLDEPSHEEAEVRPQPHPERIPETPHPQADFAPPQAISVRPDPEPEAPAPFDDPMPFFLRAPEPEAASEDEPAPPPWASRVEFEPQDESASGPDLFRLADEVIEEDGAEPHDEDHDEGHPFSRGPFDRVPLDHDRRVIDDQAPFGFDAPVVQPLPERPEGGLLTLAALAVLGLVFFGGGVFWATYARAGVGSAWLGPKVVGGLAGIAGVGFFVVAVYLLLDRLGRAAEREARDRR